MRRFLLILVLAVVALLVIAVGGAAWLIHDEAFLRAQVSRIVHAHTGRELRIQEPLSLALGRQTTLETGGIVLANADWAENPEMVRIGRLKLTVDLLSLIGGPAHLHELELEDCTIELIRNDAGEANWALAPGETATQARDDAPSAFPRIDRLAIDRCDLTLDAPERTQALSTVVTEARLVRTADARAEGHVDGSLDGENLAIRGWIAPVTAFREGGPLRHELELRAGRVSLTSSGSVADALTFAEPEISTHFTGPEIGAILAQHGLPPLSEGAFDFRATFSSRDGRALVDIDGDLGSLDIIAEGELDALRRPRDGHIRSSIRGANLRAVGLALGFDLPVEEPFQWQADFRFGAERIDIETARLHTANETVILSGALSTRAQLAGSTLDLSIESAEIGRWLHLAGRPEQPVGPLELAGSARVDERGLLSIDATARQDGTLFEARGPLGPLNGPYEPDLDFRFESENPTRLAAAAGLERFPSRPVRLQGHVTKKGKLLTVKNFDAWLGPHHAFADGTIVLDREFRGSELELSLEIPNLAEFGALFERPGLPAEALRIDVLLWPDGPGLGFDVSKAEMGRIRLALEGRIVDLAKPAGVDARFDIHFPDAAILTAWLPGLAPPTGPFMANGALEHRGDLTQLEGVAITVGENELRVDGSFTPEWDLDLQLKATGPDLSDLDGLARTSLPAAPFAASTGLTGRPAALEFKDLSVRVGRSEVSGSLSLRRGERTLIQATLKGNRVDLNHWIKAREREPEPEQARRYVFDDTPIMYWADHGLDIDATVRVDELLLGFGQYTDLDTRFVLNRQEIAFNPFTIQGFNEGRIDGRLELDSSGAIPQLVLEVTGNDTRLTLAAAEGQAPETLPLGDYRLQLRGRGRTNREMAASLDGLVRVSFGSGKLAPMGATILTSDFVTELLRTLNPWSKTEQFTELECAVIAADIESGQMKIDPAILHLKRVTVLASGGIDLASERIDLRFDSRQREGLGVSATDLVNPFIKVGGTLAKPSLELDPARSVVGGGLAVATAGLSILAKSLAERFLSTKDPCGKALEAIRERDAQTD